MINFVMIVMIINKMEIEKITGDEALIAVYVEAVIMPNGELIRYGKSLGFIDKENLKGIFKEKQ